MCVCVCVCVHLNALTNHHSNRAASTGISDLGSGGFVAGGVTDTLGQETDSSTDRVMYVGNSYLQISISTNAPCFFAKECFN